MASAKAAGARFERAVADWLAERLNPGIDRRVTNGAHDRGDIGGVRDLNRGRVVLECKDYGGRLDPGTWIREAERERVNDGATVGLVVAKRRGISDPGSQYVLMTLRDLAVLLGASRTEVDRS